MLHPLFNLSNWLEHMEHLWKILEVLRLYKLYVWRDKCSFGKDHIAYLGHVISKGKVAMDQDKIVEVQK